MAAAHGKSISDISGAGRRTCHRWLISGIADADEVCIDFCCLVFEASGQDLRLIVAANETAEPVQGDGDEKIYGVCETASLQGGIEQEAQNRIQLCAASLEGQDHFSQGFGVNSCAGYLVEINL